MSANISWTHSEEVEALDHCGCCGRGGGGGSSSGRLDAANRRRRGRHQGRQRRRRADAGPPTHASRLPQACGARALLRCVEICRAEGQWRLLKYPAIGAVDPVLRLEANKVEVGTEISLWQQRVQLAPAVKNRSVSTKPLKSV